MEYKAAQKRQRDRETPGGYDHADRIISGIPAGRKYAYGIDRIVSEGEHVKHIVGQHLDQVGLRLRLQSIEEVNQRPDDQEQAGIDQPIDKGYSEEAFAIGLSPSRTHRAPASSPE